MLFAMSRQLQLASPVPLPVPRVPAWAMPRARVEDPVEAAFMAGSALNALDNLVRAESEWNGAWRHRLALKAASACMTLLGRAEAAGPLPRLNVQAAVGQMIGVMILRHALRVEPMASASEDELVELVAPTLQHYLD